jgi:hypothetical protein
MITGSAFAAPPPALVTTFGGADGYPSNPPLRYCLSGSTTNHDLVTEMNCAYLPSTFVNFNADGTITTYPTSETPNVYCLDIWGNDPTQTKVDWTTCNQTHAQYWTYFDGQIIPYYHPGYCLTVDGNGQGDTQDGTPISIRPCNRSQSQLFAVMGLPMKIQSAQYSTCMENPISNYPSFVLGTCDDNNQGQDFLFSFQPHPPEGPTAISYNVSLETLTPGAAQSCVGWDGVEGDFVGIDRSCQSNNATAPWDYWQYTAQRQLANATNSCLDLKFDDPNQRIDEYVCGTGNNAQIWNIWLKGFPTAPCRGLSCF